MRLQVGGSRFEDVAVPVLWGTRAILEDSSRRLSVVNLSGPVAVLEVLGGKVAQGAHFAPTAGGFKILDADGRAQYTFFEQERRITADSLQLPDIEITDNQIRVGTNVIQSNMVSGYGVGIAVEEQSISIGAPLPRGLAALVV